MLSDSTDFIALANSFRTCSTFCWYSKWNRLFSNSTIFFNKSAVETLEYSFIPLPYLKKTRNDIDARKVQKLFFSNPVRSCAEGSGPREFPKDWLSFELLWILFSVPPKMQKWCKMFLFSIYYLFLGKRDFKSQNLPKSPVPGFVIFKSRNLPHKVLNARTFSNVENITRETKILFSEQQAHQVKFNFAFRQNVAP